VLAKIVYEAKYKLTGLRVLAVRGEIPKIELLSSRMLT
jgi:hypothetical protein